MSADESPGFVARILSRLFDDGALKILSIAIAIALFAFLHGGSDAQRTIDVDLIASPGPPPGRVLLTPLPERVHVTVQGPRSLLNELSNEVDPLVLDLSNEPQLIDLDRLAIKLPTGVQRLRVLPPLLELKWDSVVTRKLRVDAVWSAPPEGLSLRGVTLDPSMIAVTGPRSRLDILQRLRTTPLDLSRTTPGAHTIKLPIDVTGDATLASAHFDVDLVDVHFDVTAETKTRTFPGIPVVALKGHGATLRPHAVSVVVTCPPRRAEELTADLLVPKIDLDALGADFGRRGPEEAEVKLDVPGCSDVTVTPPRVTVTR